MHAYRSAFGHRHEKESKLFGFSEFGDFAAGRLLNQREAGREEDATLEERKTRHLYDHMEARMQGYASRITRLHTLLGDKTKESDDLLKLRGDGGRRVLDTYDYATILQMSKAATPAERESIRRNTERVSGVFLRVGELEKLYARAEEIIAQREREVTERLQASGKSTQEIRTLISTPYAEGVRAKRVEHLERQINASGQRDLLQSVQIMRFSKPFERVQHRDYHLLRIPQGASLSISDPNLSGFVTLEASGGVQYCKFEAQQTTRFSGSAPFVLSYIDAKGAQIRRTGSVQKTTDGLHNLYFVFDTSTPATPVTQKPVERKPEPAPEEPIKKPDITSIEKKPKPPKPTPEIEKKPEPPKPTPEKPRKPELDARGKPIVRPPETSRDSVDAIKVTPPKASPKKEKKTPRTPDHEPPKKKNIIEQVEDGKELLNAPAMTLNINGSERSVKFQTNGMFIDTIRYSFTALKAVLGRYDKELNILSVVRKGNAIAMKAGALGKSGEVVADNAKLEELFTTLISQGFMEKQTGEGITVRIEKK